MKKYKVYLFDFDLTLADASAWIVECFQTILHRHGYTSCTDSQCRSTIGMVLEDAFEYLTGVSDPAFCHDLRLEYRQLCRPQVAERTHFIPGAEAMLRSRTEDIRIGIVSTKQSDVIWKTLRLNGLENTVDHVIGIEEVQAPKPAPYGILNACSHFGVDKSEVLYCGDSTIDAEAAKNAGVDFAAVTTGNTTRAEFEAYPHVAILDALSPDYLA